MIRGWGWAAVAIGAVIWVAFLWSRMHELQKARKERDQLVLQLEQFKQQAEANERYYVEQRAVDEKARANLATVASQRQADLDYLRAHPVRVYISAAPVPAQACIPAGPSGVDGATIGGELPAVVAGVDAYEVAERFRQCEVTKQQVRELQSRERLNAARFGE